MPLAPAARFVRFIAALIQKAASIKIFIAEYCFIRFNLETYNNHYSRHQRHYQLLHRRQKSLLLSSALYYLCTSSRPHLLGAFYSHRNNPVAIFALRLHGIRAIKFLMGQLRTAGSYWNFYIEYLLSIVDICSQLYRYENPRAVSVKLKVGTYRVLHKPSGKYSGVVELIKTNIQIQ